MPKMKTHSGAKKRFRKNKNGLIKAARSYRRHLLTCKTTKRKRGLRSPLFLQSADCSRVTRLLPYE
ncbi:MAG TPA: 50S ribosomal protein L35 [Candidatus Babeliaceae bacterium]|nr:50S ribosomal protein L35 [Candidatus Babeliaceae bacterium]